MTRKINYIPAIFIASLLLLLCSFYYGQTNRNAVIGSYIVTSKRYDGFNNVIQTCNIQGKFELTANDFFWGCNECVLENDSSNCNGSGWTPPHWNSNSCATIKVFPDSTLLDTTSCTICSVGKLFPNDSLYLKFKWCTTSDQTEISGFKLYTVTNINELILPENALLLSPNPATDIIHIQSTQYTFTEQKPLLYDLKGQIIYCNTRYINSHTYDLEVSALDTGIYFIFIQTNKGYLKKKVLVSR